MGQFFAYATVSAVMEDNHVA
ncbi:MULTISPECIES: membrane protein YoeI [Enterobacteriaceae]|uniref:Membrane protein YoeI n=1 Tax=Citrobacter pasteurii TaxID=1563222 RepID=A0A6N6K4F1_9ENTR|nr:membrane protein YoeI [Citrobacter sp. FDAARGOS_156]AYL64307.1 membrane protein YoeI [Citrobacter pasteurii]EIS7450306.1 membrane protein YoeI [Citrobacter youngae]EKU7608122.1 membrane protein YoeI [Citrobacter freundii]MBA7944138.1 membrane protein YoeI [Citrobacter sp. RHBSTW-00271]MBA7967978.1 membrane protein YoeI [Citrobacter sp. RHBSTW-00671]MBA8106675.1 membrane protein YoeI [Citrobacter sp. RHBSTW-00029]MBD0800210.1 membrane protein YoeI [Citrobacter sp. C6_1]MBD0812892.1 membra